MKTLRSLAIENHAGKLIFCLLPLFSACAAEGGSDLAVNERECRTFEAGGSKMRRSVCMTREEWAFADAQEQRNEQAMDEFFRRALEAGSLGEGPSFDSPAAAP